MQHLVMISSRAHAGRHANALSPTDAHAPPTSAHAPPTDAHALPTDAHAPPTDAHMHTAGSPPQNNCKQLSCVFSYPDAPTRQALLPHAM